MREPSIVFQHGKKLLDNHASSLGTEKWDVYEQTAIAALDLGHVALAQQYVDKLKLRWTDSTRVEKLQGMVGEAAGNYDAAIKLYRNMMKKNPANALAHKRIVSVYRAQGRTKDAIKELTEYLKNFSADISGWQELASLEMSVGNASEACFGYEELILADPMNYLLHSKYAELLYTVGGIEKLKAARRHFVQSIHFKPKHNVRAMLGVCMSSHAVATTKTRRSDDDDATVNDNIYAKASGDLLKAYADLGAPSDISAAMERVLQQQKKAMKA
jgi:tetratricopeptide (TPR) repeat protein